MDPMSDTARVRWTVYGTTPERGGYQFSGEHVADGWAPPADLNSTWQNEPGRRPVLYVAAWTIEDATREYQRLWAEREATERGQHRHP